jgi:hypothetical protein
VSELDAGLLVRRTRLLPRFYPPGYRARRGEEIFGTLLDTTRPGRGWPPAREVASVINGGLRARRAANLHQGLRASLRHVGILAIAMLMGQSLIMERFLDPVVYPQRYARYPPGCELGVILGSVLMVLAVAGSWSGRRWLVAAAVGTVAAAAACSLAGDLDPGSDRYRATAGARHRPRLAAPPPCQNRPAHHRVTGASENPRSASACHRPGAATIGAQLPRAALREPSSW